MNQTLVTSYVNPDLDGVACMVAYAEFLNKLGRPAVALVSGEPHLEALWILQKFNINPPLKITDINSFDQIIQVDNSLVNNLHPGLSLDKVVEIIDHRKHNNSDQFKNAKVQIELVGSAATLIAEKFKKDSLVPSGEAAILLAGAIISNTLNFQSGNTTDRDKQAFEWLKTHAQIPTNLAHEMFAAKSDLSGPRLQKALNDDAACYDIAGKKFCSLQLEIINSEQLIKSRKNEILETLKQIENNLKTDSIFLSILDLEKNFNTFVTTNPFSQDLLAKVLGIQFDQDIAIHQGLVMRKEIVPKFKELIEKNTNV